MGHKQLHSSFEIIQYIGKSPIEFDKNALELLRIRYNSFLGSARERLSREFKAETKFGKDSNDLNWNHVARFLILCFISCDALNLEIKKGFPFCLNFVKHRVIPFYFYNKLLDIQPTEQNIFDLNSNLSKIGIWSLSAQLHAFIGLTELENGNIFFRKYAELQGKVVDSVFLELSRRKESHYLDYPEELLNTYNSDKSPLYRSSTLETTLICFSMISGYQLCDLKWLRSYEEARQLIDDLSDLKDDIRVGRLTLPYLIALNSSDPQLRKTLKSKIYFLWDSKIEGQASKEEVIKDIFNLLLKSNALKEVAERISVLLNEAKEGIESQNFPGNDSGLFLQVELKKAYLDRIRLNDFQPLKVEFDFYKG